MAIGLDRFIEVAGQLYKRSIELGIPAISPEDGLVLSSIAFIYCASNSYIKAIDAGAGIGYSTIYLAYGMGIGCRGELTAVENRWDRFEELRANLPLLKEIAGDKIEVKVRYGDALEFLRNLENKALDIAFVDIEKSFYPEALRILRDKLKMGGIAIFHNAIAPRPPREFFEIAEREYISTIIPSEAGILLAYKAGKR
ncbi:MAG: class I SAM-dependent methyltransferase [Sulfolobales archaeon]